MLRVLEISEKLIDMANHLIIEHPDNSMLKRLLQHIEEVKTEFLKPDLEIPVIYQLAYGIVRIFQEIPEYERTPFGDEVRKLLLELNKYIFPL